MSLPPEIHTTRHALPGLSTLTWEVLVALIFAAAAAFFWVQNYSNRPTIAPTAAVEAQPAAPASQSASPRFE